MISAHRVGRLDDEVALVALLVCRVLVQEVRGAGLDLCVDDAVHQLLRGDLLSVPALPLVALVQLVELGATDESAGSLVRTKRLQSPPLSTRRMGPEPRARGRGRGAILAGAAVPPGPRTT
jgi:hypothetical protein